MISSQGKSTASFDGTKILIFLCLTEICIISAMETIKNIQKVGIWFFAILGGTYILTGLMILSDFYKTQTTIIHQTIQIPFIISALIYGISQLVEGFTEPGQLNKKVLIPAGATLGTFIILIIVFEIIFPDLTP